ncbi:MAG TPA: lipoate protein ligase C-terminal domain-containing protein, partial [Clostridia bacterium]|nr:lipoate protein ligase C-terminal domain-containing protein [Clostridia bacterium]
VEKGLITQALIYSDALDSDFIGCLAHQLEGLRFNGEDMAQALSGLGKASDTVGEISQKIIADDIASAIRDQSF